MAPFKGVEFIEGKIIKQPPAAWRHQEAAGRLSTLLSIHVHRHGLGKASAGGTLIALTRNDYEPDILFFGPEKATKIESDQMISPAPDFVAEVHSPSTGHWDRGIKKQDHAAHGVSEYWIVDPVGQVIEQYQLDGVEYRLAGVRRKEEPIESFVVHGFSMPVFAAFDADANVAALSDLLR